MNWKKCFQSLFSSNSKNFYDRYVQGAKAGNPSCQTDIGEAAQFETS
jgi:hypothetical protein